MTDKEKFDKIIEMLIKIGLSPCEAKKQCENFIKLSIDLANFQGNPGALILENLLDFDPPGNMESLKRFGVK